MQFIALRRYVRRSSPLSLFYLGFICDLSTPFLSFNVSLTPQIISLTLLGEMEVFFEFALSLAMRKALSFSHSYTHLQSSLIRIKFLVHYLGLLTHISIC